jgi:hypothetical protein
MDGRAHRDPLVLPADGPGIGRPAIEVEGLLDTTAPPADGEALIALSYGG